VRFHFRFPFGRQDAQADSTVHNEKADENRTVSIGLFCFSPQAAT
jgi:hypothetical protein